VLEKYLPTLALVVLGVLLQPQASGLAQDSAPGATLFHQYCASCHGENGAGNGPVAPYLTIQPADLTTIAERRHGEFPEEQILRIITGDENPPGHGTRTMPVWGERLQDDLIGGVNKSAVARGRIAFLVDHLKALQGSHRREFDNVVIPGGGPRPGGHPIR
jgi:mono/diheme cytochrome c family protein